LAAAIVTDVALVAQAASEKKLAGAPERFTAVAEETPVGLPKASSAVTVTAPEQLPAPTVCAALVIASCEATAAPTFSTCESPASPAAEIATVTEPLVRSLK